MIYNGKYFDRDISSGDRGIEDHIALALFLSSQESDGATI